MSRTILWKPIVLSMVLLLLLCSGCTRAEEETVIEQLTPEELLEYIEIFKLDCDLSDEDILAGKDYILTATEETEDFLFRLNFFTGSFHSLSGYGFGLDLMSDEFREMYQQGVEAKQKYTGHLIAHWNWPDPFLDIKHVVAYPEELYYFYTNLPEGIQYRINLEKDELFLPQYLDYIIIYAIEWSEGPWFEYDGTGILEVSEWRSMEGLDKAEFFTQQLMKDEQRKIVASEYGITENAPLEFSWIINHPKEAYDIIINSGLHDKYEVFHVSDRIVPESYLKNSGIPFFPPEKDPEA